jgi:hypothetical protein
MKTPPVCLRCVPSLHAFAACLLSTTTQSHNTYTSNPTTSKQHNTLCSLPLALHGVIPTTSKQHNTLCSLRLALHSTPFLPLHFVHIHSTPFSEMVIDGGGRPAITIFRESVITNFQTSFQQSLFTIAAQNHVGERKKKA